MKQENEIQLAPQVMHGVYSFQTALSTFLSELVSEGQTIHGEIPAHQLHRLDGRLQFALSYYLPKLKEIFHWLYESREDSNYTYDLSPGNKQYLALFISSILQVPLYKVEGYIRELDEDKALHRHITETASRYGDLAIDIDPKYGRRLGWYAFVRALKPKVVIETGVDKGLGSCVLTAALMKNAAEGQPGYYYGTDINPEAGYLFQGVYKECGTILYGDSIESLKKLNVSIDLFINDSDHSASYEMREYETILNMLSPQAVLLADNAHSTDCLARFSAIHNRSFLFFQERPDKHWYPGAGIGVSFQQNIQNDIPTRIVTDVHEGTKQTDPLIGALQLFC